MGIGSSKEGFSLFGFMNKCVTPMGRALLRQRFTMPSRDLRVINARLDAVELLMREPEALLAFQKIMRGVRDVGHIMSRSLVGCGQGAGDGATTAWAIMRTPSDDLCAGCNFRTEPAAQVISFRLPAVLGSSYSCISSQSALQAKLQAQRLTSDPYPATLAGENGRTCVAYLLLQLEERAGLIVYYLVTIVQLQICW